MNKKKQIIWTCIFSLALFLILFFILSQTVKEDTYTIFLVNRDLRSGTVLDETMLTSVKIPYSSTLPQTCRQMETIKGKTLNCDLNKGEVLSVRNLQPVQDGISYPDLDPGMVLYTLALEPDHANGWWIAKGNRVNLYLYTPAGLSEMSGTSDEVINPGDSPGPIQMIESVKIMRIMDENGKEAVQGETAPAMVCLEITKKQAETLFEAENVKKIKLIAENPEEKPDVMQ